MALKTSLARRAAATAGVLACAVLAGCGKDKPVDEERTATLIQPVARVSIVKAAVEPGKRSGEDVAKAVCSACHGSGALNAPKTGDKAAWAPRIAQGYEVLVKNAIAGKNQMPPRGGAADLTDDEIARAVAWLANQAGADFKGPPL